MRGTEPEDVFDLTQDTALAWYFVMAHWPDAATRPALRMGPGPLRVAIAATKVCYELLRVTLIKAAENHPGALNDSAATLMAEVDSRDRPQDGPSGASMQPSKTA